MKIKPLFFLSLLFFISFFSCEAGYFQQHLKYIIHVRLDDRKNELNAEENIIYKNNSVDTLKEIYFHLWPAAYKNQNTIFARELFKSGDDRMMASRDKDHGNMDSLDFRVNGEAVEWNILEDTIDICKLILHKPLKPGDSAEITTPFRVKVPAAFLSRLGHDGQAYFITQWFPKPAVFDKNGWNYFPYLDQGEYYGEFGSFDVYITLPDNYVLAATGIITDGEKEIEWLEKNDLITRTIKTFPDDGPTPLSSMVFKTIHFHQDSIHDFAWFADKRWHVIKDSIILKGSGKKIITWSYFNNKEASYWLNSPQYIKDAIQYYSEWAGEYPFGQISMVDVGSAAGNGMEYPMISTIGNYNDRFELELTIIHEACHNWFYGILGNNERCHPWMDEGIVNFYETRYVYTKYKNNPAGQEERTGIKVFSGLKLIKNVNHKKRQYYGYLYGARKNTDQQPDLCSDKISNINYQNDVYYKSSISFDYLKTYLGDSVFDECMKAYFNEWKFRHPQPADMKEIFVRISGKNLNWFFDDLLQSTKKLDYKISSARLNDSGKAEIEIKNLGGINSPVILNEIKNNNIIDSITIEGFEGKKKFTLSCVNCDSYRLDAQERMPELYENNNIIRMKGLFRKTEKINFSFGTKTENPLRTQVYYFPVIGWNNYNKLMAGIVIHNISFLEKKFEYRLMPMYAFNTNDISGGGDFSYHIYPYDNIINKITLRSGISRYAFAFDEYSNNDFTYSNILHYTKIDSRIILSFREKDPQEHFKNEITFRNIFIDRGIPYEINYSEKNKSIIYWQLDYSRSNSNPLDKSLQKITFTFGDDLIYAAGELRQFITYGKINKGFGIRLFAGYTSLPKQNNSGIDYKMNLSGRDGSGDYLFDEVYLGRTETTGILSKQFVNDYAGFRTPTSFYRLAEKWMFGFNVNTTLPGILPFRLFANTGIFDNSDQDGRFGKISWEIGVDLPLIKDIFVVSLPFAYSNDIKYAIDSQKMNTADLIRFELHLNLLNPLDQIKNIYDN